MKIKQSFEQAICILFILGKENRPVISTELSDRLEVSDSFLKIVMRLLVVQGIVESIASKKGGFILKKSIDDITFLDIFNAIEGKEHFIETTHLVEKTFVEYESLGQIEKMFMAYFNIAENSYRDQLQKLTLGDAFLAVKNLTQ